MVTHIDEHCVPRPEVAPAVGGFRLVRREQVRASGCSVCQHGWPWRPPDLGDLRRQERERWREAELRYIRDVTAHSRATAVYLGCWVLCLLCAAAAGGMIVSL